MRRRRSVVLSGVVMCALVWVAGTTVASSSTAAAPSSTGVTEVRVGDATVVEGNGLKNQRVRVPVSLSSPLATAHCVRYHTEDVSATGTPRLQVVHDGSADYQSVSNQVVMVKARAVVAAIQVKVLSDNAVEGPESLRVVVDAVTGTSGSVCNASADPVVSVVDGTGVVSIVDDDPAPLTTTVSIGDVSLPEGNTGKGAPRLVVTSSAPMSRARCVFYHTVDGSATGAPNTKVADADHDYLSRSGKSVRMATGTVSATVNLITTLTDTAVETDETFDVVLDEITDVGGEGACETTPAPGVAIGDGTGVVTITNDDGA